MSDVYRNYLLDLGREIREAGTAAKAESDSATDPDRRFQLGRRMAYYEVLSLMQQQAVAFNLPLGDLSLGASTPSETSSRRKPLDCASAPE